MRNFFTFLGDFKRAGIFRIFAEYRQGRLGRLFALSGVLLYSHKLTLFSTSARRGWKTVYSFYFGKEALAFNINLHHHSLCFVSSSARFWMSPKIIKCGYLLYFKNTLDIGVFFPQCWELPRLSSAGAEGPKVTIKETGRCDFQLVMQRMNSDAYCSLHSLGLLELLAWSGRRQRRQSQV